MATLQLSNRSIRFSANYLFLITGRVMPLLALLAITLLFSRWLSFEDYGIFQSVWMYTNIVSVVLGFGITTIIFSTNISTLVAFTGLKIKLLRTFYSVLWMAAILAFLLLSKHFTAEQRLVIAAFIMVQNFNTVAESLLIKRGGEKSYCIINLCYALLFLGWHIYIAQTNYSLQYLMTGILILSFIKLAAIILLQRQPLKVPIVSSPENFTEHWLYVGVYDVMGIVSKWADKLILVYILSASEFAVFFNGSIEIPLFGILTSVTGSYMMLYISKQESDSSRILNIFRQTFVSLSAVVFPLFFFFFFFRYEVFTFLFGNAYREAVPIFAVSLLVIPLRINNYTSILQCFSKGKIVAIGSLIDLVVAIVLVFILYKWMGMPGAALAMVLSTLVQSVYYLYKSAAVLNTTVLQLIPWKKLLINLLFSGLVFYVLSFALQRTDIKILLAAGAFSVSAVAAILYFTFNLKKVREAH